MNMNKEYRREIRQLNGQLKAINKEAKRAWEASRREMEKIVTQRERRDNAFLRQADKIGKRIAILVGRLS